MNAFSLRELKNRPHPDKSTKRDKIAKHLATVLPHIPTSKHATFFTLPGVKWRTEKLFSEEHCDKTRFVGVEKAEDEFLTSGLQVGNLDILGDKVTPRHYRCRYGYMFNASASTILKRHLPYGGVVSGGWLDFTGGLCPENHQAVKALGSALDKSLPFNPVAFTILCGRESFGYEELIPHLPGDGEFGRLWYLETQCAAAAEGYWDPVQHITYINEKGRKFLTTVGFIRRHDEEDPA